MNLVVEGKVSIVTYGTVLENVGLHGIFGELALIDNSPRSAAALAAEACEVARSSIATRSSSWCALTRHSRST